MEATIRHTFNTDAETYWTKVFFSRDYNTRLFAEALGFGYEILSLEEEPNGVRRRKVRIEPKADMPGFMKKLVGDGIQYVEEGSFDPTKKLWSYKVTTSKLSEKINISGTFFAEPKGEKQVDRVCVLNVVVKIPLVGSSVEEFIIRTTRESYDKVQVFTNKYIESEKLNAAG
jgi:hypothetical protein